MNTNNEMPEAQPPSASGTDDHDEHIIRLSAEGQRRFAELLINPPEPSPGLVRAFEAHRRLIGEP